jgi:hypothetical protein
METLLFQKIRDARGHIRWAALIAVSVAWITFIAASVTGVAAAWKSVNAPKTSDVYSSYEEQQETLVVSQLSNKTWLTSPWFGDNGAVLNTEVSDDPAVNPRIVIAYPSGRGVEIILSTLGATTFKGLAYGLSNGALLSPLPALVKMLPNDSIRVIVPGDKADHKTLMDITFARGQPGEGGYGPLLLLPTPLIGYFAYMMHKRGKPQDRRTRRGRQQTA